LLCPITGKAYHPRSQCISKKLAVEKGYDWTDVTKDAFYDKKKELLLMP
jgi:hypothetical protein